MSTQTPAGGHTAYGITVYELGEDGDLIAAFGHHHPRRFLAACNHLARTVWGLANLWDDRSALASDAYQDVSYEQAYYDDKPDDEYGWFLHPERPTHRPELTASPVMFWRG